MKIAEIQTDCKDLLPSKETQKLKKEWNKRLGFLNDTSPVGEVVLSDIATVLI